MTLLRLFLTSLLLIGFAYPAGAATFLHLQGQPGEYVSGGNTYFFTPQDGTFTFREEFDDAVTIEFRQNVAPFHSFDLTFEPFPGSRLEPGVYSNATRWPFNFLAPGLNVVGDGNGCNTLTGNFQVMSSSYDELGAIRSLHVRFEQYCESPSAPLLSGEVALATAEVPTLSPGVLMVLVAALATAGLLVIRSR